MTTKKPKAAPKSLRNARLGAPSARIRKPKKK